MRKDIAMVAANSPDKVVKVNHLPEFFCHVSDD
jgi:hypothetical protein